MKKDYRELVEVLKNYDNESGLNDVEVYVGEINGDYDTEYSNATNGVLDTIISDGNVLPNPEEGKVSYEVSDSKYTLITRYKRTNDKGNPSGIEKVFLFIDEKALMEVRSYFLQYDEYNKTDLYFKIFSRDNYKGSVANYKKDNKSGNVLIYPSEDLILYNEQLHNRIDSNIYLGR